MKTLKIMFSLSDSLPFKGDNFSVVASSHGMVCYHDIRHSDLILWNPVRGDYKTLSKSGSHEECYDYNGGPFGLYYSSSDDDYKLLRVTLYTDVYIYSLKSDSWRKVELEEDFRSPLISWMPSTALLNEKLYFLQKRVSKENDIHYSIIRFDTKTEQFTEIATPFSKNFERYSLSFLVLRGYIHVCENIAKRGVIMWRMDGDGDWTKVVSLFPWCLEPLHLMRNDNWLMRSNKGNHLYQVDMKKHTKTKLCSLPRTTTIVEYKETIVSPNSYTK